MDAKRAEAIFKRKRDTQWTGDKADAFDYLVFAAKEYEKGKGEIVSTYRAVNDRESDDQFEVE